MKEVALPLFSLTSPEAQICYEFFVESAKIVAKNEGNLRSSKGGK